MRVVGQRREEIALAHFRINRSFALCVLLLFLTFFIRITNLDYNGVFVDEAIYVAVGQDVLSGTYSQNATSWMYGSYLYPIFAATVNHIGGLEGLRASSAVLTTVATAFVFLVTWRLFGNLSGLWAILLFGLSVQSINLGQLAVYDAPAIALLAIALYYVVAASLNSDLKKDSYFFIAALCFIFAVLFKYTAGFYLPALILIGLIVSLLQGQPIRPLFTRFLLPVICVLGVYAVYYRSDLIALLKSNAGVATDPRGLIVQTIGQELGFVILLSTVGVFLLLRLAFRDPGFESKRFSLILAVLFANLIWAVLAAPAYHLLASNSHALERHSVYSLIFLCPLAGYVLAALVQEKQAITGWRATVYGLVGAAITFVILIGFVNNALDQNWGFQHSWPDVRPTIKSLRALGLNSQDVVLAEGSASYEYYFNFGSNNDRVWSSTWYLQYHGLQGTEAMVAAIQDHYFDFVILDDYFTPETDQALEAALTAAHYRLAVSQQPQILSTGQRISCRIYTRPGV